MSNHYSPADIDAAPVYQIRVKGHLGHEWISWFGGLSISQQANGDTLLTGPVADQAALYGLLRSVRDLGLPLLSLLCVEPEQPGAPETHKGAEQ